MLDNLKESPEHVSGWFGRARRFLVDVRAELGRVTWPTRREVWATEYVPDSTHVVDVHLANLRRKLRAAAPENDWIRTIRGVGFRFDPCCA